jgi:hypothetical protein
MKCCEYAPWIIGGPVIHGLVDQDGINKDKGPGSQSYTNFRNKIVFVPGKPFQPSPSFVGKARDLP